jgi:hypothetical protein
MLTKQGQYLAFIYYTKIHGEPPSEADMQIYFGVSPPSVHQMVVTHAPRPAVSASGTGPLVRVLLPKGL